MIESNGMRAARRLSLLVEFTLWAIWLGGMWTLALLVAPALFKWLPRPEAGLVARRLFMIYGWLGLVLPLAFYLLARPNVSAWSRWQIAALVSVAGLAGVGLFVIHPQMVRLAHDMVTASAGEGASLNRQFGRWHAVSSVLFSLQMLIGLWWGWRRFLARPVLLA
ncbi:MAG: DUF4149 domain-containing protein [Burkholderiaceae bacterium]